MQHIWFRCFTRRQELSFDYEIGISAIMRLKRSTKLQEWDAGWGRRGVVRLLVLFGRSAFFTILPSQRLMQKTIWQSSLTCLKRFFSWIFSLFCAFPQGEEYGRRHMPHGLFGRSRSWRIGSWNGTKKLWRRKRRLEEEGLIRDTRAVVIYFGFHRQQIARFCGDKLTDHLSDDKEISLGPICGSCAGVGREGDESPFECMREVYEELGIHLTEGLSALGVFQHALKVGSLFYGGRSVKSGSVWQSPLEMKVSYKPMNIEEFLNLNWAVSQLQGRLRDYLEEDVKWFLRLQQTIVE